MELLQHEIYWIRHCSYPAETELIKHQHFFFHYLYIVDGKGKIVIDKKTYDIKKETLYLIPPRVDHSFFSSKESALVTIELKFDILDPNIRKKMKDFPYLLSTDSLDIGAIFSLLANENTHKTLFSEDIVALKFQELVLYLLRFFSNTVQSQNTELTEKRSLDGVLDYIYTNLGMKMSLDTLAEVACLEKTYFLKKFKKEFGKTPMKYIRDVRIRRSCDLLTFSDMSITQVAAATGFQSVHHFSNAFHAARGISPQSYKAATAFKKK